jgi:hypothetical protein
MAKTRKGRTSTAATPKGIEAETEGARIRREQEAAAEVRRNAERERERRACWLVPAGRDEYGRYRHDRVIYRGLTRTEVSERLESSYCTYECFDIEGQEWRVHEACSAGDITSGRIQGLVLTLEEASHRAIVGATKYITPGANWIPRNSPERKEAARRWEEMSKADSPATAYSSPYTRYYVARALVRGMRGIRRRFYCGRRYSDDGTGQWITTDRGKYKGEWYCSHRCHTARRKRGAIVKPFRRKYLPRCHNCSRELDLLAEKLSDWVRTGSRYRDWFCSFKCRDETAESTARQARADGERAAARAVRAAGRPGRT